MSWWLYTFSRGGPARYLSHLDTTRAVRRTFARAGIELALSHGMRPKARLALPLPLPVGAAGLRELAVVEVAEGAPEPAAALAKLAAAAPPGFVPLGIEDAGERHPRPHPTRADYACGLRGDADALTSAVDRFACEAHIIRERFTPKGGRTLDLKEYVVDTGARRASEGVMLRFAIRHRAAGAARPKDYVDLIAEWAGVEPVMHDLERVGITWKDVPRATSAAAEGVDCCDTQEEGDDR
jgi:radical SAM-linked protein